MRSSRNSSQARDRHACEAPPRQTAGRTSWYSTSYLTTPPFGARAHWTSSHVAPASRSAGTPGGRIVLVEHAADARE